MKRKQFWLGMLVMLFGMMVVGYIDAQENSLNGTWIQNIDPNSLIPTIRQTFKFDNGNFEQTLDGFIFLKGIYTIGNGRIMMNITHIDGSFAIEYGLENKWYSKTEWLEAILKLPEEYRQDILSVETAHQMFSQVIINYSLNMNILTFTIENETTTYTRF